MNALILSVGDELVLGQTVDTNSAWLSQQCAAVGCGVVGHATVGDDRPAIEAAIAGAAGRADVILISGGIGPTEDDLTRQAVAAVTGTDLVEDERWTAEVRGFFRSLGREMPAANRVQSMIPRGAEMIWNTCGTAAGIKATIASPASGSALGTRHSALLFAMPGVPKEMKAMFARDVLPWLRERAGGAAIRSRTLHTFGLGESAVAERLGPLMARGRNPSVGTTVAGGIVSLRVNARFPGVAEAEARLEETAAQCRAALGDVVFGQEEETLAVVVGRLLLADPVAQKWAPAVATAESCTGGLVAKMLTDVPGSSRFFRQGWVTYDNEAKQNELGVPGDLIATHGAVSEPVAREMASGARVRSGGAFALALTGVAGPGGGTPEKPAGTVWIALAHPGGVEARRFGFPGDREMVRDRSAKMALTMLRFHLLGKPLPF